MPDLRVSLQLLAESVDIRSCFRTVVMLLNLFGQKAAVEHYGV
jgi:hypothetical protein